MTQRLWSNFDNYPWLGIDFRHRCFRSHFFPSSVKPHTYLYFMLKLRTTFPKACAFPKYGANCGQTCQCGSNSERCDHITGCVCSTGFTGATCETDINECATDNVCGDINKVCTNSVGSYTCPCREGYELATNGTCVGMYFKCSNYDKDTNVLPELLLIALR